MPKHAKDHSPFIVGMWAGLETLAAIDGPASFLIFNAVAGFLGGLVCAVDSIAAWNRRRREGRRPRERYLSHNPYDRFDRLTHEQVRRLFESKDGAA